MMQLGTGELTRISRRGGAQNAWSPDGRQVAYGTSGGLQIVNVSTSELRTVGEPLAVAYPAFSRDGTRVAFQGWDGREYRLYQVSLEDGRTQVIPTPPGEPGNPSWSPDGRTVYFQLDQYGRRNIWAVDLPSSQSRQLTEGDKDDAHPDVSADGRRLLFLRQHRAIYVMAADGTDGPALVADLSKDGHLVEWPAWGLRDETIVFSLAGMTGDLLLLNRQEIR